ncbi:protein kinase [Streptomyces sp. NPDC051555]|uniref:protein kinase domain-containing protein n=1 Tax=Streptomyces sp. NPDC051555 TaxID=3365657 RepID=UPI0037B47C5F
MPAVPAVPAPATAVMGPLLPGDPPAIASYRLVGRLGTGGMGVVYAAVDGGGRRVALKTVHPQLAADPQFRARFHREVGVLRRVTGPCLVPLVDADPDAAAPWLVTTYVPGPTLHQYVAAHGPLTGARLHLLAAGTAAALAAVHAAGVVHRDLKPANVILSPDGPRVLDFGIAHVTDGTAVTRTGVMTGTPGWISPEQYRDGSADSRGDVFAWGALIAAAATGRPVFGTGAPDAVAYRVLREEPDLAGVPDELHGVLVACLAKEPGERPRSRALAVVTARLVDGAATEVLPVGRPAAAAPVPVEDAPAEGAPVDDALIAARWDVPSIEDPSWGAVPPTGTGAAPAPAGRGVWVRRGLFVAAAAALGGVVGLGLSLLPSGQDGRDGRDGRDAAAAASSSRSPEDRSAATSGAPATPPRSPAGPLSASSSPPSTTGGPGAAGDPGTGRTAVHTIAPWSVAGGEPAEGVTITAETIGSCWTVSSKTPRSDAWRCMSASTILDPCFAPGDGAADVLLCLDGNARRMQRLILTQPLPADGFRPPGSPAPTTLLIELANGKTCGFASGATSDLAGKRLDYFCEDGGTVYGDPDRSRPLWTADYRKDQSPTTESVPIRAAYQ